MWARIKRGLRKPPRVIVVRGLQEARLLWREKAAPFGLGWAATTRRTARFWTPERAAALESARPHLLFAPGGAEALKRAIDAKMVDGAGLVTRAADIARRRFDILGAAVPAEGPMPWTRDWRFEHAWPARPERHINHMAPRSAPWDVKYPWELSRLHILPPLVLGAVVTGQQDPIEKACCYLADWQRANPLGRTVNWAPMESSMRVISLCLTLEMMRAAGASAAAQAQVLVALHRSLVFVEASVEDTDVRGNHFTANLAALMLGGSLLAPIWPGAARMVRYAMTRLDSEVALQFTPDGVNFEKSTFYHRLVTELFLLMVLVADRTGRPVATETRDRLAKAAEVTQWWTGPDGAVPVWGDSDDAEIFTCDGVALSDHSALLGLAGVVAGQGATMALPSTILMSGAVPKTRRAPPQGARHFAEGGFAIVRDGGAMLLSDLGEVGMNGRGGHGHNDCLSFALWVAGQPLIVDPGSYIYSGDLAARERFRGTAAHNMLMVSDTEIARLGPRPFRTHPDAVPLEANLTQTPEGWRVEGGHRGYMRLTPPVLHRRVFTMGTNTLDIRDLLEGPEDTSLAHSAKRLLQFAPGTQVVAQTDTGLDLEHAGTRVTVQWDKGHSPTLEEGAVSLSYAQASPAPRLCLSHPAPGPAEMTLRIAWGAKASEGQP